MEMKPDAGKFKEAPADETIVEDVYCVRQFMMVEFNTGEIAPAGITFQQPIREGVNIAQCELEGHAAPSANCRCGWYCYDELAEWDKSGASSFFTAIVRISGRSILHSQGIRAERIELIAAAPRSPAVADLIREHAPYVRILSDLEALFHEYPVTKLERGPEKEPADLPQTPRKSVWPRKLASIALTILAGVAVGAGILAFQEGQVFPQSLLMVTLAFILQLMALQFFIGSSRVDPPIQGGALPAKVAKNPPPSP